MSPARAETPAPADNALQRAARRGCPATTRRNSPLATGNVQRRRVQTRAAYPNRASDLTVSCAPYRREARRRSDGRIQSP